MLFNVTPDQPWSPDTVSYSGSECCAAHMCAALRCVPSSDAMRPRWLAGPPCLPVAQRTLAPLLLLLLRPPPPTTLTLTRPPACPPLSPPPAFTDAQLREALAAAGHPEASLNNHTPDIFLELIDGGGGLAIEDQAGLSAAPAPEGGQVGAVAAARRRGLLQEVANDTAAAGTCGAGEPSRIIGFIFDSVSRYKLKPVLKDTTSLPKSVRRPPPGGGKRALGGRGRGHARLVGAPAGSASCVAHGQEALGMRGQGRARPGPLLTPAPLLRLPAALDPAVNSGHDVCTH